MSTVNTRFGEFTAFGQEDLISESLRLYGEWAGLEIGLQAKLIKKGATVVDVGAFIGTHSRAYSELVGPKGRVISFEPNPQAFVLLKANARKSEIKNIQIHQLGLGAKAARLNVSNANGGNAGQATLSASKAGGESEVAEVRRIDDVVVGPVHFMKLDVEGMERQVLSGGDVLVHEYSPVIFAECNSIEHGVGLLEWAREKRYKCLAALSPAFNPGNFNGNGENIFGDASEVSLIMAHRSAFQAIKTKLHGQRLAPVIDADDLALVMLHKHQYVYEVLKKSRVARTYGMDFPSPRANLLAAKLSECQNDARHKEDAARESLKSLGDECNALASGLLRAEKLSLERLARIESLDSTLGEVTALSIERLKQVEKGAEEKEQLARQLAETRKQLDEEQLRREYGDWKVLELTAETERLDVALGEVTALSIERLKQVEKGAEEREQLALQLAETRKQLDEEQLRREDGDRKVLELTAETERLEAALREVMALSFERLEQVQKDSKKMERLNAQLSEMRKRSDEEQLRREEAEKLSIERLDLFLKTDAALAEAQRLSLDRLARLEEIEQHRLKAIETATAEKDVVLNLAAHLETQNHLPGDADET